MSEISSTGDLMLTVLESVAAHGPVSATQCARLCDINRTVAHRLLTTLARRLYVIKITGGYVLGPAAMAVAAARAAKLSRTSVAPQSCPARQTSDAASSSFSGLPAPFL